MLPILKNALVTKTCKKDFMIRKAELEWFTSNYWVIATQATVVGGFSFHQLSSPAPEDTATFSALFFVTLTTLSFILALYVIVRCTFSCILATGLALRGLRGFDSMNEAISYLRKQQDRILWCFLISLACFILSSFMMVYVFRRRRKLAIRVEVALHLVTCALAFMAVRVTYLFYHESAARSGVDAIEKIFADVGDIDASVAPPTTPVL